MPSEVSCTSAIATPLLLPVACCPSVARAAAGNNNGGTSSQSPGSAPPLKGPALFDNITHARKHTANLMHMNYPNLFGWPMHF
jgi:hypothetical protein